MTRASLPGLHFLPALAGSSMHRWLHRKRPGIDWVTVLPLGAANEVDAAEPLELDPVVVVASKPSQAFLQGSSAVVGSA